MRKQCLCGKFVFLAFKAVSLDCAAPLMTFFQAEIKIVIIYSELILIFAPFMIFQSILDVFFHTIKTMYTGHYSKKDETYHESSSVLSITHFYKCEDAFDQVCSQRCHFKFKYVAMRYKSYNGLNLVINSKSIF